MFHEQNPGKQPDCQSPDFGFNLPEKDERSALPLDNYNDYPGYKNKWKVTDLQLVARSSQLKNQKMKHGP